MSFSTARAGLPIQQVTGSEGLKGMADGRVPDGRLERIDPVEKAAHRAASKVVVGMAEAVNQLSEKLADANDERGADAIMVSCRLTDIADAIESGVRNQQVVVGEGLDLMTQAIMNEGEGIEKSLKSLTYVMVAIAVCLVGLTVVLAELVFTQL